MISRRQLLAASATAVVTAVSGCAGPTDGQGAGQETSDVSMADSQFQPRNIHVDTGTTVTWTNEGSRAHTVTSASDNWSQDTTIAPGEEATHTFADGGVYDVYCTYHGSSELTGMSMKVGVGDATIENPAGGDGGGGGGAYG